MTDSIFSADDIDTSKPHPARMYDYYLGGKDNYPADWKAAEQVMALFPDGRTLAQVNRAFMHCATRMVTRAGIRQFLDIGTGIPTEPNLHQIAQTIAPDSRVVYVDNDPIVLRHAEALLSSTPEGSTSYVQADVRETDKILGSAQETLDLNQPVALSLNALLHFVPDEYEPYELVRKLVGALAPGSYLVLSHVTPDFDPETWEKIVEIYRSGGIPAQARSRSEIVPFFEGLDLVDPGLEAATRWRPELERAAVNSGDQSVPLYVGVGRKV